MPALGGTAGHSARKANQDKAERDEDVTGVQHQHEPVRQSAVTGPARETNGMKQTGEQQKQGHDRIAGRDDPARQRDGSGSQGNRIEPAERNRQPAVPLPRQPIARKARHDAPAYQRDHQDDARYPGTNAVVRGAIPRGFQVERHIAGDQDADDHEHAQIPPIATGHDLARRHARQHDKERNIDCGSRGRADFRRHQNGGPAGQPKRRERGERSAVHRQTPGPVRDRRQQKAGDHRGGIAEEHLMDVPVERRQRRLQADFAEKLWQPQQDAECGPAGPAEEERTEAVGEQRRAGVVAAARKRGGNGHRNI